MEQQRVEAVNSAVSSAEAAAQAVPCQCRLIWHVSTFGPKTTICQAEVVDASAKQLLQQLDVGEPMMQLEQQTPDGAVTAGLQRDGVFERRRTGQTEANKAGVDSSEFASTGVFVYKESITEVANT